MSNFTSVLSRAQSTINVINRELASTMPHAYVKSVFDHTSETIHEGQIRHSLMDYIVYRMKARNNILPFWEFEDLAWTETELRLPQSKNWRAQEAAVHQVLEEHHALLEPLSKGELIELSYT